MALRQTPSWVIFFFFHVSLGIVNFLSKDGNYDMKEVGMLVVSRRGENFEFLSHLVVINIFGHRALA